VKLYAKSKIGVIGLVVIVFFVVMAVFSPTISPTPPLDYQVAAQFSIPSWATIFPQYRNVAVDQTPISTGFNSQQNLASWSFSGSSYNLSISPGVTPPSPKGLAGSLLVNASLPANETATDAYLPGGVVLFSMNQSFKFSTAPPPHFELTVVFDPVEMQNVSKIYWNFIIYTPSGNYTLSSALGATLRSTVEIDKPSVGQWDTLELPSGLLSSSGLPAFFTAAYPSKLIFNQTGTYKLGMQLMAVPAGNAATGAVSVYIASVKFHLDGGAYGLLGTDNLGNDVWSQLVWGSRISMMVGIAAGLGSVLIGAIAGIAAGYVGGLFGDVLSRVTDFFLVLPFLPLLIVITSIIAANPLLISTVYFWIILVFVVLTWPFIAILIRAQTVSVKERQYVEASRAVGGGTSHIMSKHILPNVLGLVYSQIALNVSGFIILDASLDFLSIANHGRPVISWGIMLANSLPFATGDPQAQYVWWWFLPPGISIAALSLAFVLVGFALDSIFNPRLRAR
jgi:peptide/nickel transport system permease protein